MKKKYIMVAQFLATNFRGRIFSYGNEKILNDTLIVNLESAKHCSSDARGFCVCSKVCYAKKLEKIYINYANKLFQVEKLFNTQKPEIIFNLICAYIEKSPVKIKYIRLNEAGDFRQQSDIDMWNNFNMALQKKYDYFRTVYAYTCRIDLDFSGRNFVLNASRHEVRGFDRLFMAVSEEQFLQLENSKTVYKCPGKAGCKKCHVCFNDKFTGTIYAKIH